MIRRFVVVTGIALASFAYLAGSIAVARTSAMRYATHTTSMAQR